MSVSTLVSGDIQIANSSGGAVASAVVAGANLVMTACYINTLPYELVVQESVKSMEDLKGKSVGISRVGSASDVAARVLIKGLGLEPVKDVPIMQVGGPSERAAAFRTGKIVGFPSPPGTIHLAKGMPHRIMISTADFQKRFDFPYICSTTTKSYLASNRETMRKLTMALIEATHFLKTRKQDTMKFIAKYTRQNNPQFLESSWAANVKLQIAFHWLPGKEPRSRAEVTCSKKLTCGRRVSRGEAAPDRCALRTLSGRGRAQLVRRIGPPHPPVEPGSPRAGRRRSRAAATRACSSGSSSTSFGTSPAAARSAASSSSETTPKLRLLQFSSNARCDPRSHQVIDRGARLLQLLLRVPRPPAKQQQERQAGTVRSWPVALEQRRAGAASSTQRSVRITSWPPSACPATGRKSGAAGGSGTPDRPRARPARFCVGRGTAGSRARRANRTAQSGTKPADRARLRPAAGKHRQDRNRRPGRRQPERRR